MKINQRLKLNIAALLLFLIFSLAMPQSIYAAKKPAQVKNLKCGVTTGSSINISWSLQSGVSGYHIFRASSYDGPYQIIKTISAGNNAFCNMNLPGGREYYYRVRAYTYRSGTTTNGKFSKILAARTKCASRPATVRANSNVRKHAGINHQKITTLPAGTRVTIICSTTNKSGTPWSRITFTSGGKKGTGYIQTSLLTSAGQPQPQKKTGIVTANSGLRLRRSPSTNSAIVTTLKKGSKVTILGQVTGSDRQKWYKLSVKQGNRTFNGYAAARYIRVS